MMHGNPPGRNGITCGIRRVGLILSLLTLWALAPLSLPAMAGTPVVDDPTFIIDRGTYAAPEGDMDLLLLRELAFTSLPLTGWVNEDPNQKVVKNSNITTGTHTCVQSLLVRFYDANQLTIFRTSQGVISLNGPPEVTILGAITDFQLSKGPHLPDNVLSW